MPALYFFRAAAIFTFTVWHAVVAVADEPLQGTVSHPRLYLTADDLPGLRASHNEAPRDAIWRNLCESADWCAAQPVRSEWIPTKADDPQYENLYDRFYAAMHDLAIVETLAFASVLSDPEHDPYFDAARDWLLASARVWGREKENPPDASKAYAVLRIMKGLAVGYDVLYPRLTDAERTEVREAIVPVMDAYHQFFQDPTTAGAGYNKHHGSVDAAPFGVVALALRGEVPQADDWLALAIEKHTGYLLTESLTPSGTNDQSSNFWASTLLYRIQFLDALRRVTGRDLFQEFPRSLPGRMALAAVVGRQPKTIESNECHRSVLFGPNYGQLNYWSPVMVFLAKEQRRSTFQYLALWDEALGTLQHTRFITPTRREELLFGYGPYAFLWCDPTIPATLEPNLPLAFEFPEPEVNEAYLRASYELGGLAAGMKKGGLVIHAGGRPVLVDQLPTNDTNKPAEPVDEMLVADDGRVATIRCVGPKSAGIGEQWVELTRPGLLTVERETEKPLDFWFAEQPHRDGNTFRWPDGTELIVVTGEIAAVDNAGYTETPVHFGGMKLADPCPRTYTTVKVDPAEGLVRLEVRVPSHGREPER